MTFLQLFLIVDVFLAGALTAAIIYHARAHVRQDKSQVEKNTEQTVKPPQLPVAMKEHILKTSQDQFQAAVNTSATQLHSNLEVTASQINKLVGQLGTKIIGDELERYQNELSQLRKQAEAGMGEIRNEVAAHEAELKAKLAQEIEAEKQRLIQQIDTKLGDAVASFLLETLQHNVDLGNQTAYLTAMLDEHKAEFIKEVQDDQTS